MDYSRARSPRIRRATVIRVHVARRTRTLRFASPVWEGTTARDLAELATRFGECMRAGTASLGYCRRVTRSEVAKRLNKSRATVRRLEGVDLFPRVDSCGVHHFNSNEVDAVARRLRSGEATAARGRWLYGQREPSRKRYDERAANTPLEAKLLRENATLRAKLVEFEEFLDEIE